MEGPGGVGGPEDVGGGGLGGGAHPRPWEELHEVGLGEAWVEGGLWESARHGRDGGDGHLLSCKEREVKINTVRILYITKIQTEI